MSERDKLQQNIVRVECGDTIGTGFFIGCDGSLLTCFHVVGNKKTGKLSTEKMIVNFNEKDYPAKCIFFSPDPNALDIAILRLNDGEMPPQSILLPIGEWKPDIIKKPRFRTFGFRLPDQFEGLFGEGEIRGPITKSGMKLLHLASEAIGAEEIRKGMSGAPVYHEATGQIIGMISLRVKEDGETIPCAVPIEVIANFWPSLADRLLEEILIQQLSEEVFLPGKWFTEDNFKSFYEQLRWPFSELERYDNLQGDKIKGLLEQLRGRELVYDLINCIRIKRPDIPLKTLIELPPIYHVNFINREDELNNAYYRYAPSKIIFDAPAGYGKTQLLKEIERRHFRDEWLCIYIEIPENTKSIIEIVELIALKLEYTKDISKYQNQEMDKIGIAFASLLEKQLNDLKAPGIILLFDNIERLPIDEIDVFLNCFLTAILEWLEEVKIRIHLAGRYVGSLLEKKAKKFKLSVKPLTPFRLKYVEDTVRRLLPTLEEPEIYAAHLMHITGGHPGCMAEVLRRLDPNKTIEENIEENDQNFKEIVLLVAHEVKNSISKSLWNAFDVLSIFRRFNYGILQKIKDEKMIEYPKDHVALLQDLTSTYLIDSQRKDGFIQDEIVRRLLAIRLRLEENRRFMLLCKKARQIYVQELPSTRERSEYMVMEAIFQELQLQYYSSSQNLRSRKILERKFFAEDGILNSYLKKLFTKPEDLDIVANFIALLEDKDYNWEFQFVINFFLREDHYNNIPYEKMLKQVENFFTNKTKHR